MEARVDHDSARRTSGAQNQNLSSPLSHETSHKRGRETEAPRSECSQAGQCDLPVYTCNPDYCSGIDGLEVVAVPVPD